MSEPLAPDVLIQTDELLRKEADDLLHGRGLLQLLEGYGTPHVVGSYSLELMAWRDLDLYLENDRTTETEFFELGGRLASLLRPTNMRFRDTRVTPVEGLPPGMYWGVYMDRGIEDAWKIDIWALDSEQSKRLIDFQDDLAKRVTAAARLTILRIKSQVWRDPEYRHSFTALEIYRAVLDHGIENVDGFREYLKARGLLP